MLWFSLPFLHVLIVKFLCENGPSCSQIQIFNTHFSQSNQQLMHKIKFHTKMHLKMSQYSSKVSRKFSCMVSLRFLLCDIMVYKSWKYPWRFLSWHVRFTQIPSVNGDVSQSNMLLYHSRRKLILGVNRALDCPSTCNSDVQQSQSGQFTNTRRHQESLLEHNIDSHFSSMKRKSFLNKKD